MFGEIKKYHFFSEKECSSIIKLAESVGFINDANDNNYAYSCDLSKNSAIKKIILKKIKEYNLPKSITIIKVNKYFKDKRSYMPAHIDMSRTSISIKLNNDYNGGGLYFPLYNKIFNNVKVGEGITWVGNKLMSTHEVLEVNEGTRYSLLIFGELDDNIIKIFCYMSFNWVMTTINPFYYLFKFIRLCII